MNKMTAREIFNYLGSFLDIENMPSFLDGYKDIEIEKWNESQAKLGTYKRVHKDRIGDDKDITETVYYFVDHDCFIKFTGWYSSYEGTTYEDWAEVIPVEKTITIYEAV